MKLVLAMFLSLVGCVPYSQVVDIPISAKPNISELPPKPYLPIYSLSDKNSPDEVVKAYVASIRILKISEDACRIKIEGIKNAS